MMEAKTTHHRPVLGEIWRLKVEHLRRVEIVEMDITDVIIEGDHFKGRSARRAWIPFYRQYERDPNQHNRGGAMNAARNIFGVGLWDARNVRGSYEGRQRLYCTCGKELAGFLKFAEVASCPYCSQPWKKTKSGFQQTVEVR